MDLVLWAKRLHVLFASNAWMHYIAKAISFYGMDLGQ